jgi:hypothetical protein
MERLVGVVPWDDLRRRISGDTGWYESCENTGTDSDSAKSRCVGDAYNRCNLKTPYSIQFRNRYCAPEIQQESRKMNERGASMNFPFKCTQKEKRQP